MGVPLALVNFDQLFEQAKNTPLFAAELIKNSEKKKPSKKKPTIVNTLRNDSEEANDLVNSLIYTRYTTDDLLSNLPRCECGQTTGEYRLGVICSNCGQEVVSPMDQELEPIVWIKAPIGVERLINPKVWCMLNDKFRRSGFEIMRWICDSRYVYPLGEPPVMTAVRGIKIAGQSLDRQRGYNFFVRNFDQIIDALYELKVFRPSKRGLDPLQLLLRENRDCIFSEYLPLPNRSLLVIEESNVGLYRDPIVDGAVDAIRKMVAIDNELSAMPQESKENYTIRTIHQLMEFYDGIDRTTLAKKEGIFRKHVAGTRCHWSGRAVISSLTNAHRYDELHIPWGIGTSIFRIHLVNKLLRGRPGRPAMTVNEAVAHLNHYAVVYDEYLDELFQELIAECTHGDYLSGIPVVFQRNPSLERGSAQAMYVTRVKTATEDPTIGLSILAVKGFNADFDGDQLNMTLSLDRRVHDALRPLSPHMSAFDLNEPRKVSKNLSMPGPVVATIASWMHDPNAHVADPVKLAKMAALPDAVEP